MSHVGVFENIVKPAVIRSVDYGQQVCWVQLYDRTTVLPNPIPLNHAAASVNGGFFIHPEEGTVVLIGWGYAERPFILSYLPNSQMVRDLTSSSNVSNLPVESTGYPHLRLGEVALAGKYGTSIKITDLGDIELSCGGGSPNVSYGWDNKAITNLKEQVHTTQSEYSVSGTIQRDLRLSVSDFEELEDKYTSFSHNRVLSEIGRDPDFTTATLTTSTNQHLRNPAFAEKRNVVYEFARDDMVDTVALEVDRMSGADNGFLDQPNRRDRTKYDVLNLNHANPNLLMETVSGTLVDIYGNILDINRNVITVRDSDRTRAAERLSLLDEMLRRSVKFHIELNAKKSGSAPSSVTELDGEDLKIGYTHSRWSLDVDGEGLTKINIPSSSNTGNIPLLTRYVNGHLKAGKNEASYKDPDKKDIKHLPFGTAGIDISETYAPESLVSGGGKVKYQTAYHDIVSTGQKAHEGNAITTSLSNTGSGQNAGGRSVHANLDGSLELNVGRDYADKKSIVLDTAGGIVSRIGKMSSSSFDASVISQLDGSLYIQIGGDTVGDDDRLRDPKVKIVVVGSKGTDVVQIDDKAVRIKSASGGKNIVLDSSANIVLKAAKHILLAGVNVGVGGSADEDGNSISPERTIHTKGKVI